jgi:hypothetical protein
MPRPGWNCISKKTTVDGRPNLLCCGNVDSAQIAHTRGVQFTWRDEDYFMRLVHQGHMGRHTEEFDDAFAAAPEYPGIQQGWVWRATMRPQPHQIVWARMVPELAEGPPVNAPVIRLDSGHNLRPR